MKTNLLLRVLCGLLVVTMLCVGVIACKDNNGNSNNDNKPPVTNNPDEGTEDTGTDYLLQVERDDFGNDVINVLCRMDKSYEIDVSEDASALVEKAVFNRNARVEEYLNVDIVGVPVNGS